MRLGIIECGRDRPELRARFGRYSDMFVRLLTPAAPELEYQVFDIVEGEDLGAPNRCDAWLIGGSPSGVYDADPWIARLADFVREAYAADAPLIGVCFGHQMLAQALGGDVAKSDKGWGCGVHRYALDDLPSWMRTDDETLRLRAMHQDQVVAAPAEATRLAGSVFCPNAALVYGEPERPKAFSLQPHPEFEADFAAALIDLRRLDAIPDRVAEPALKSLSSRDPRDAVMSEIAADWIASFLRRTQADRVPASGEQASQT